MDQTRVVKIVILGSSGVGKSSIINRYINKNWNQDVQTTLGAAFMDKFVQYRGRNFKFQIWDTAGQEKYGPLAQMYYRDADVAILVYDSTDKQTFSGLKTWHMELSEKGPKNLILAIVGNKVELTDEQEVSESEGGRYASKHHAIYKATSAKENTGIEELFENILDDLLDHSVVEETHDMNTSKLVHPRKQQHEEVNKRCC